MIMHSVEVFLLILLLLYLMQSLIYLPVNGSATSETYVRGLPASLWFLSCLQEKNSSKRQTPIEEMR